MTGKAQKLRFAVLKAKSRVCAEKMAADVNTGYNEHIGAPNLRGEDGSSADTFEPNTKAIQRAEHAFVPRV
jgi:hypothetical protein